MRFHPSPFHFLTWAAGRVILPLRFDIQVNGLSLLPEKGPVIFIPKHQQWWDVPLLGTFIPRPLHFLAKQELFNLWISRFYITRIGGIPLDRQRPLRSLSTFRSLIPLIKEDAFLVIFPEGTYYPATMGPGKWRLIQMILRLQQKEAFAPIAFIPLGIRYETSRSRRIKVIISIGEPLSETDPSKAETFTNRILKEVKTLTGLPQ
jgi:1-acyl-sn-glycerol-3-phosphate acyltransferase